MRSGSVHDSAVRAREGRVGRELKKQRGHGGADGRSYTHRKRRVVRTDDMPERGRQTWGGLPVD